MDGAAVFYLGHQVKKFDDFDAAYNFISNKNNIMTLTRKENVEKPIEINIIKEFSVGKDIYYFFMAK